MGDGLRIRSVLDGVNGGPPGDSVQVVKNWNIQRVPIVYPDTGQGTLACDLE